MIDFTGSSYYATGKIVDIPRALVDGFNSRDFSKTLSVLSDDVEWLDIPSQSLYRGKEGYRQFDETWLKAFPDGKAEIINVITQGDRVVVEYVGRGTHMGPLTGPMGVLRPTGRRVQLPMCDVMQIQDGKVIRGHTYYNAASVFQQLEEVEGQAKAA
jgi:steroid delta-isomerase-like uncharacterized protein